MIPILLLESQGLSGWLGLAGLIFGVVSIVGGSILILRSRAREEAHKATLDLLDRTQKTLAQSEKELGIERKKVEDRDKQIEDLTEERDALKTAYTSVAGITVKELETFFYNVIGDVRYVNAIILDKDKMRADLARVRKELSDGSPAATD